MRSSCRPTPVGPLLVSVWLNDVVTRRRAADAALRRPAIDEPAAHLDVVRAPAHGEHPADLLRRVVILDRQEALIAEERVPGDLNGRQACGTTRETRQVRARQAEQRRRIGALVRSRGGDVHFQVAGADFADHRRTEDARVVALVRHARPCRSDPGTRHRRRRRPSRSSGRSSSPPMFTVGQRPGVKVFTPLNEYRTASVLLCVKRCSIFTSAPFESCVRIVSPVKLFTTPAPVGCG